MTRPPPDRRLLVDGRDVAACRVAGTYLSRLRGLLGRRRIPEALLLRDCTSVHGAGMTVPLDVALLDADLTVLRTGTLRPFAVTRPRPGTRHVLEAQRGAFAAWGVRPGVTLAVTPPSAAPDGA